MTTNKNNFNLDIEPVEEISSNDLFGFNCPFKVFKFKKPNEYVPQIDEDYKFDPDSKIWFAFIFVVDEKFSLN